MKKLTPLILLSFLLFLNSCKKDDDNVDPNAEFFTAKYGNGEDFMASGDSSEVQFIAADIANPTARRLSFHAWEDNPNNNYFKLTGTVIGYAGVGTYYSGGENGTASFSLGPYYSSSDNDTISGFIPGELVITFDNGEYIEGTLNFDGYSSSGAKRKLYNGSFRINYGVFYPIP